MPEVVTLNFFTVLQAMLKVFLIIGLGFWLRRRRIINEHTLSELANLMILLIIPSFFFVRVFREFSLPQISQAYQMGLFALLLTGVALLTTRLILFPFALSRPRKKTLLALCSFGNSGYLPIPMVYSLLPQTQADRAALYIALFVFFVAPLMWTFGAWLLRGEENEEQGKATWTRLVTPPAIGIVVGIVATIPPIKSGMVKVEFLVDALDIIGQAMVPLAMIILGGMLASVRLDYRFPSPSVALVVFIKLLFLPLLVFIGCRWVTLPPLMKLALIIEAGVPPAANLAVIARRYEGEWKFVSMVLTVTYLLSIVTLPVFLHLYLRTCH